jgi:hypothetical protein
MMAQFGMRTASVKGEKTAKSGEVYPNEDTRPAPVPCRKLRPTGSIQKFTQSRPSRIER